MQPFLYIYNKVTCNLVLLIYSKFSHNSPCKALPTRRMAYLSYFCCSVCRILSSSPSTNNNEQAAFRLLKPRRGSLIDEMLGRASEIQMSDVDSIIIDENTHGQRMLMNGLNQFRQGTAIKILKLSADSAGDYLCGKSVRSFSC